MADFVSHHLFGRQALTVFPAPAQRAAACRPACFFWGCQGPDPLFYRKILLGSPLHKLGNRMHSEKTDELFAALARNAVAGKDFVMKTTGESTRMYSYTADAVSAILTVLVAGENGVSYNVANPSTYSSIREMADMVYREFGTGDARVIIDVDPNAPYPPEHHLPLDVSRLEALGWRPQVGLEDMYRKLIAYMG